MGTVYHTLPKGTTKSPGCRGTAGAKVHLNSFFSCPWEHFCVAARQLSRNKQLCGCTAIDSANAGHVALFINDLSIAVRHIFCRIVELICIDYTIHISLDALSIELLSERFRIVFSREGKRNNLVSNVDQILDFLQFLQNPLFFFCDFFVVRALTFPVLFNTRPSKIIHSGVSGVSCEFITRQIKALSIWGIESNHRILVFLINHKLLFSLSGIPKSTPSKKTADFKVVRTDGIITFLCKRSVPSNFCRISRDHRSARLVGFFIAALRRAGLATIIPAIATVAAALRRAGLAAIIPAIATVAAARCAASGHHGNGHCCRQQNGGGFFVPSHNTSLLFFVPKHLKNMLHTHMLPSLRTSCQPI